MIEKIEIVFETDDEPMHLNIWIDGKCWSLLPKDAIYFGIAAEHSVHTDAPKPFVNHCNPVNGVHAPFCNGDHSPRGQRKPLESLSHVE